MPQVGIPADDDDEEVAPGSHPLEEARQTFRAFRMDRVEPAAVAKPRAVAVVVLHKLGKVLGCARTRLVEKDLRTVDCHDIVARGLRRLAFSFSLARSPCPCPCPYPYPYPCPS